MIELINIEKSFIKFKKQITILKNINLNFKFGKFYAIMGESGSGKSTLLNIIGLLDNPSSGILMINNLNTKDLSQNKLNELRLGVIGYVFQECFLSENLTVFENIILPLSNNKNISQHEKINIVNELILMVKLNDRRNHFPKELSGGERQRVALARSLVNNPDIILADEPTGNLDKENEIIIFNLLKKLSLCGKCVIVVSHSELIKNYADEVIILNNGITKGELNGK